VIFPHWTFWRKKEHEQVTFYPVDGDSIMSLKNSLILYDQNKKDVEDISKNRRGLSN